jgi:helicase
VKTSLPLSSGLSSDLIADPKVIFQEDGVPSLTDVQWKALDIGIGRGESVLALAPTSTGKTQIGIWALAAWITADKARHRGIYLVTHRSLANQKFEEFHRILANPLFGGAVEAMVLATGDRQVDASGVPVNEPLRASLLVATYEKYLGLLCAGGIPSALGDTCIVADEIQILGDKSRGVNVETLLTLIRQAEPGQFVGLSAVLTAQDGQALADWLEVQLLRVPHREKHLLYECRTTTRRLTFNTETANSEIHEEPCAPGMATELQPLICECLDSNGGKPVVVFCMRKQDVYDGCQAYCQSKGYDLTNASLLAGLSADTPEADLLSATIPRRVAIHCADLIENDRLRVEEAIKNGEIDLVFATSTLAAGVNFPLGTVIFYSWRRWNFERRLNEPISTSEFHNMAGRCGRLGAEHESGHVIFLASDRYQDQAVVRDFLNSDHLDSLESQISPDHFTPLVLQLAASHVASTEQEALAFLKATFGASRELQVNAAGLDHWDEPFQEAVANLRCWSFLR